MRYPMLTARVAVPVLLALFGPSAALGQGFRTEPVEHMAFLGDPVQRFLTWAQTRDAVIAHHTEAALRIEEMANEIGARIALATPIGFDSSLVAAFRSFHAIAAGVVAQYEAARLAQDEHPGAPMDALRAGSPAIVAAIPPLQEAVGAFARQHEATSAGLVCRRVGSLMALAAAGGLQGPDSFLGTALVRLPFEDSLWGNLANFGDPDGYAQSTARLRQIAAQIRECTGPDGSAWAVAEQERTYATENNVLLFVTPDGVPHTGDGDPVGPHFLFAASPQNLLLLVKAGAR